MKKHIINFINSRFVRGNINRNDRCGVLHRAWGHVFNSHIQGDYIEFGVYQGASLIESYKNYLQFETWLQDQLKSTESSRVKAARAYLTHVPSFHGLDTFGGMPENVEENINFLAGSFNTNINQVRSLCHSTGLKEPQLQLYKGTFQESKVKFLSSMRGKKAAILNIDSDLYGSAQDALLMSADLIQVGTVLLFDDYNAFSANANKGERLAFREFLEITPRKFETWMPYAYAGQAFLCVA